MNAFSSETFIGSDRPYLGNIPRIVLSHYYLSTCLPLNALDCCSFPFSSWRDKPCCDGGGHFFMISCYPDSNISLDNEIQLVDPTMNEKDLAIARPEGFRPVSQR
jgi:hypothetical protein